MKFNKFFSVLASTALLVGSYACTDKIEPTPSPVAGNEEVYFPYTDAAELAIPVDATQISVTVNRIDATEESTVALSSLVYYIDESDETNPKQVDVTDIFTIPASVTFPKDVKEVTLEIGVDFPKVVMDRAYNIDLTLETSKTGSYGLSHRVFTATYLPWTDWDVVSESEPGIYTVAVLANGYFAGYVYYRQSLVNENLMQYSMFLPWEALDIPESSSQMIFNVDASQTIEVDGVECPLVWMEGCIDENYVHSQTGEAVYYSTVYTWLKYYYDGGGAFKNDAEIYAVMENNGFSPSYYNPVQGRLYLYMKAFSQTYYYGGTDTTLETLQLPGDYKDYYFTFNYEGNLVSNNGKEYALVQVVPSDDIDHFACEILPGALSDAALEDAYKALEDDTDAELIYDGTYTMNYAFPEGGKYTAIAVGYNKENEVVCTGSKTYAFETVQSESEWKKVGTVDYTDGLFVGLCLNEKAIDTWEVELEEHKEISGYYRMVNPYANWLINEVLEWPLLEGNYYIELDARDPKGVLMPLCELGIDCQTKISNSEIMGAARAMSDAWYNINYDGSTLAKEKANGNVGVIADNQLTFPTAGLLMVAGNGKNIFYTNLDPMAPEGADVDYGTGCFNVDFSPMVGAPAKKIHPNVKGLPSLTSMKRLVDAKKANSKTVKANNGHELSQKEVRELRLMNAKRF